MEDTALKREIKLNQLGGKYKAISSYKIPDKPEEWLDCPACGLKPLVWVFNNGCSTACGCGENEYRHFSIWTESIMSYVSRNSGSTLGYDSSALKKNWNHWCEFSEEIEPRDVLLKTGRW